MTQFSIDERTGALEEVARAGSSRQVRTRSGHGRSTVTVCDDHGRDIRKSDLYKAVATRS